MSLEQIIQEARQLTPNERAILAESLWESLGDPFTVESNEEESLVIAEERDQELNTGKVTALTHEELMGRLMNENQLRLHRVNDSRRCPAPFDSTTIQAL